MPHTNDPPQPDETARVIAQVAIAVQDSLDAEWTLEAMAAASGYAVHHFAHAFAAVIGQPPLRYVRGLRLDRAAHDLAFAPEKSVTTVGSEAGYASHEAFRRAFVREFGISPSAARTRHGSGLRGRNAPPAREEAAGVGKPRECVGGPWLETLGPLRGVCLAAESFTDDAIAVAWRRFYSAIPTDGERHLGSAVSPWGWLAPGRRPREYRCLSVAPGVAAAVDARLARWSMPRSWHARFEYQGPTAGMHGLFRWIFSEWLPRSALRCTFAPLVTLFDERAWRESGYAVSRASVYIPVRSLRQG